MPANRMHRTRTQLTIRRIIKAPRQRVFDAWTQPEHLKHTGGERSPRGPTEIAEVDLRVGGRYRLGMQRPERAAGPYVCFGEFREINEPERLVYTWSWEPPGMEVGETLVTVEFLDQGASTEIVLTHERLPHAEAVAGTGRAGRAASKFSHLPGSGLSGGSQGLAPGDHMSCSTPFKSEYCLAMDGSPKKQNADSRNMSSERRS